MYSMPHTYELCHICTYATSMVKMIHGSIYFHRQKHTSGIEERKNFILGMLLRYLKQLEKKISADRNVLG